MLPRKANDNILQLLIISMFLIMFIYQFNLLITIGISLLIGSILALEFVLKKLLKELSLKTMNFQIQFIVTLAINLILSIIFVGLTYSMIYFYFNFSTGYFYSILMLFGCIAIIQNFRKFQIFQELSRRNLLVFNIILVIYTSLFLYSVVFDISIIQIQVTNPVDFVFGLLFTVPSQFISHIQSNISKASKINFFLYSLLPLVLIIGLIAVLFERFYHIFLNKYDPLVSYRTDSKNVSNVPFFLTILLFSFLQAANGLQEFLISAFWILIMLLALLMLLVIFMPSQDDIKFFQITIILWLVLIGFIRTVYYQIINLEFIITLLNIFTVDRMITQAAIFIAVNIVFLLIIQYLFLHCSESGTSRIVSQVNLLFLVLLVTYFPFVPIKLFLVTCLEFVFVYTKNSRVSENLKETFNSPLIKKKVLNFEYVIQKLSELSIFFIAYLIL